MSKIKENHVVDAQGREVGVVLTNREYRKLLKQAEELESIRAYDAAKRSGDEAVPFVEVRKEIERSRK
ncbi:MAG: hypothetical protein HY210_04615 [Candidatus Omnitrophica bacterium]|nr:hypothetical protein [Candidatus Omnitrophota bacterium]